MKTKPNIKLVGDKKNGFVITVYDGKEWHWDMEMTFEEIRMLRELITKKIK